VYSCKKEELGSSCSTNTASATTSVKGAPACSEEEDFNLLFGQKEDEGLEPVEADDLLKVIQDELERCLKTAETNFRSDDPLL